MSEKYIILGGRPGSGKTEILIAYANQYPATTLMFSEECSVSVLEKKGLDSRVMVVDTNGFDKIDLTHYDTVCIDYIELFAKEYIETLITKLMKMDIRIIAVSQMKPRHSNFNIDNIYEKCI